MIGCTMGSDLGPCKRSTVGQKRRCEQGTAAQLADGVGALMDEKSGCAVIGTQRAVQTGADRPPRPGKLRAAPGDGYFKMRLTSL